MSDDIHDRWALAIAERDSAEAERDRLRAGIEVLQGDIERSREAWRVQNQTITDLIHERDRLRAAISGALGLVVGPENEDALVGLKADALDLLRGALREGT